jgi:hypothetical protein
MYSSTNTLGSNRAAEGCLTRVRETRTSPAARVLAARTGFECPDQERAGPHSRSQPTHRGLGESVEYALFALTLAAVGYLEALALLADAM